MVDDYRDDSDDDEARPGILSESLRKALVTGISAVVMTEEGIRSALGDRIPKDMKLPKEAINYLIQQTERTRKEAFSAVSSELRGVLENVDLSKALRRALTGLKVEVNAEFRFVEDDATKTKVSSKTSRSPVGSEPKPKNKKRKKTTKPKA